MNIKLVLLDIVGRSWLLEQLIHHFYHSINFWFSYLIYQWGHLLRSLLCIQFEQLIEATAQSQLSLGEMFIFDIDEYQVDHEYYNFSKNTIHIVITHRLPNSILQQSHQLQLLHRSILMRQHNVTTKFAQWTIHRWIETRLLQIAL